MGVRNVIAIRSQP